MGLMQTPGIEEYGDELFASGDDGCRSNSSPLTNLTYIQAIRLLGRKINNFVRRECMENLIETHLKDFKLRFAEIQDVPLILDFIRELAEYEKMSSEVMATEEDLRESIFERKMAEVIIGEFQNKPVGFALFFHNFSTFLGRPGIYLEDLYVLPEMRGKGIGKVILSFLAKLAIDRKCGRLEWWCLDWNEPSIKFYKQLGAVPMEDWTVFRVHEEALDKLAKGFTV